MSFDEVGRKAHEVALNRAFSVSFDVPGYASIHFAFPRANEWFDEESPPFEEKLRVFVEGLHRLAERLAASDDIQFVSATSWVGTTHPRFLERFGFSNDFAGSEKERNLLIEDYKKRAKGGQIAGARKRIEPTAQRISRAEFLRRYLPKDTA